MKRLISIKLQNYNGWSSALPNNSSLEFIYDDNKFNIHRVWIFNCFCRKSDWISGLGYILLSIKTFCFTWLHITNYGCDIPADIDVQMNGDDLYFHGFGTNSSKFVAGIVEIY